MMIIKRLLSVLVLSLAVSGCGAVGLLAVGEDVGKIAAIVYKDVEAGKPFAQVLADTGTDDVKLLIAILVTVANDPKLSASDKAACQAYCQPYIDQANAVLASRHVTL